MKRGLGLAGMVLAAMAFAVPAQAQIALTHTAGSNSIALGVNREGHLNLDPSIGGLGTANGSSGYLGIAYLASPPSGGPAAYYDATSPGCWCEGWGVSANGTDSGYANISSDGGAINLTVDSFVGATSSVHVTSMPGLKVSQAYAAVAGQPLFENKVTITNTTGGTLTDVKYVRVMDWDVPFTEFDEFVTIIGTATTTLLERSHNNGFNTANPLGGDSSITASTEDADFTDLGSFDHGAYFRFNFGSLDDGESVEFSIYYGAAGTESGMLAALGSVGIELYSLGQSNGGETTGRPITYAFGFKGVGGVDVIVPEPASIAVWSLISMVGAGAVWYRRRKA